MQVRKRVQPPLGGYLRFQEFNSTHSRMRSLIAKYIVQRLSSKRVRQIEIRTPYALKREIELSSLQRNIEKI